MRVPAHFSKSRTQEYERNFTGAKLEILYSGNFLETIFREIWVDAVCFLKGVIMTQCYGIILQFQGNGTSGSVEHPGSTDLSRKKHSEASEVIGIVEQGMGMLNLRGSSMRGSWWASTAASK